MNDRVDTYCPTCDIEVRACLNVRQATLSVRGEDMPYDETIAVCPKCGGAIGDAHIEGMNLERAYAEYRARHGILSSADIRSLRNSFGLSLREFSRFLGFGEQTVYRYEHGDIPDKTHNNIMLSARSVSGAQMLLSQSRAKLTDKSITRIERHVQALVDGVAEMPHPCLALEEREALAPSAANGYRRLDFDRVSALVYELANRCPELYWTKLQKAMFFADAVCYERYSCSLTGLSYAHAPFGPVMDRMDEVRCALTDCGVVELRQHDWGEIVVPKQIGIQPFDAVELALIGEVAEFVNTFGTAKALSGFSHQLGCWDESENGEIIEYARDGTEVSNAMSKRMRRLGKDQLRNTPEFPNA